jgi:Rieske 2Fe-2S family protein
MRPRGHPVHPGKAHMLETQLGPAPLPGDALERCLGPLGGAYSFPGIVYTSPDAFTWEQRGFFEGSWMCVARSADLTSPGDQRAVRVGSEGILIVRDASGDLGAFFNVCRHRGHELLEAGSTCNRTTIQCPYHAWVYELDGRLKGAPRYGAVAGFDRTNHPLVPVRVVEWNGWVFVNASGDAPDFETHAGALSSLIEPYECERLVSVARHDYMLEANWKIIVENYHECYHCSNIHPELCKVTPPDSGADTNPDGAWAGGTMVLRDHAETMSFTGASDGVPLRGLDSVQKREVLYYSLFPNLLISLHPDYVMTHLIEPLAPGRSRVECEWLFPPEAMSKEGFDPGYATEFWDVTNKQDWHACQSVQRGASSRGHRQGPLSPIEGSTHHFISMVARSYLEGRVEYPVAPGVWA